MRVRRSADEGGHLRPPSLGAQGSQAPAQPKTDGPPPAPPRDTTKEHPATQPAMPAGPPAGTGTLHTPGEAPRDVPLMSIQPARPDTNRVEVGPITPAKGVADVLMGSIGIVLVAVVASVLLGAVLGGILVLVKHRLGWGGPEKDAERHISVSDHQP